MLCLPQIYSWTVFAASLLIEPTARLAADTGWDKLWFLLGTDVESFANPGAAPRREATPPREIDEIGDGARNDI